MSGLTLAAALGAGLVAGIFFAFSAFIMAALGRLASEGGISAMQSINVAVLNPMFFFVFFGTAVLALVLAIAALAGWSPSRLLYLLAGSLLYLAGTIFVTMAFNVPLNNRLASIGAKSAEGAGVWKTYLSAWTAWNHVRTIAALLACASFIMALSE
ncbi:MAG TPA: anthrone oxygenase family protein [Bradyrhizobium sp.]|nr:anthrone oxygenase family protein [Bradyrhizobium sp.]